MHIIGGVTFIMLYILTGIILFLLYFYIETRVRYQLEFKMIRLMNQSTQIYSRGQYYEKRSYVVMTMLSELNYLEHLFINEYKLNMIYRKLLLLYPTQPYIL